MARGYTSEIRKGILVSVNNYLQEFRGENLKFKSNKYHTA